MRPSHLFSAVLAVLISPALAFAPAVAADEAGSLVTGEADFVAHGAANSEAITAASGIVLGPAGIDDLGRSGRLHTVAKGDTLWFLSAAYLGTPWVWPSVWIDNDDIDNPHLILPGDKIWITANEMRVVTDAEAESFLSSAAPAAPAAPTENFAAAFDDEAATLEAFPVSVTAQTTSNLGAGRQVTVSRRHAMGFVSTERMNGASSIVDSPDEKTWLAEGDKVYLGMGEGDTQVGEQFTIFETLEEVHDVDSNRVIGHHVNVLGWMEVLELTGDTSVAEIRMSYAEIERGSLVVSREVAPRRVTVQSTPDAIEGEIVFMPALRTAMADGGYVYLNRGELHGVEVGSELEIFDRGQIRHEPARGVDVQTPSRSVATLVVVNLEPESSVAFVLSSSRELTVGDTVRPAVGKLAQR